MMASTKKIKVKSKQRQFTLKLHKYGRTVRQKVKLFRATDPLLSVFMWGVNHTINQLSHIKIPVMLLPDDFEAHSKVKIDNHLFNKENMPSRFKVKEYCPIVFRHLREKFGIDDQEYLNSLTRAEPIRWTGSGRSGAQFLLSCDERYCIKIIQSEHIESLHSILQDYHQYVVERKGDTLLPHFLGCFRLTVSDQETYMLVMRNVFSPRFKIHKKYDLKGSKIDRNASDKERTKECPTFKDNDFLADGFIINIGEEQKQKLMAKVTSDAEFLTRLNLMDYSLLVGMHDCSIVDEPENEETAQDLNEDENGELADDYSSAGEEQAGLDSTLGGGNSPPPPGRPHSASTPDWATGFSAGDERGGGGDAAGVNTDSDGPESPLNQSYGLYEQFDGTLDVEKWEHFGIKSADAAPGKVYFVAMVDILTHYGVKKRAAQAGKTVKYGAGAADISTVKPEQYAKRFIEFIDKSIE